MQGAIRGQRPVRRQGLRKTVQMARTRCYRQGVLTGEGFSLNDVSEHLKLESAVVWIVCALQTWKSCNS